jgi:hypothetical protein
MADERPEDVLGLWQNQNTEGFHTTPDELRKRMEQMEKKLRRRSLDGYLVCGFLVVFFMLWLTVSTDPIQRLGAAMTIAGVGYLAYQVRQNRWRETPPADIGNTASADFLRTELTRQRDFHRGRTFWMRILAFFPGPMVFFAGFARAQPELIGMIRFEAITFVLLILAAIPLNRWMVRKYQRQLDGLDRMQREG